MFNLIIYNALGGRRGLVASGLAWKPKGPAFDPARGHEFVGWTPQCNTLVHYTSRWPTAGLCYDLPSSLCDLVS